MKSPRKPTPQARQLPKARPSDNLSEGVSAGRDCWNCSATVPQEDSCPFCDAKNPWGQHALEPDSRFSDREKCTRPIRATARRLPKAKVMSANYGPDYVTLHSGAKWALMEENNLVNEGGNSDAEHIAVPVALLPMQTAAQAKALTKAFNGGEEKLVRLAAETHGSLLYGGGKFTPSEHGLACMRATLQRLGLLGKGVGR